MNSTFYRIFLIAFILLIEPYLIKAQLISSKDSRSDSIYFHGKITGGQFGQDSLWIGYNPNLLTAFSQSYLDGAKKFYIKPLPDGSFSFKLKAPSQMGNIIFSIRGNKQVLGKSVVQLTDAFYSHFLVERNDSIYLSVKLDGKGSTSYSISGNGNVKYNAINVLRKAMQLFPKSPIQEELKISSEEQLEILLKGIKIRRQAAIALLDLYKPQVSDMVYQTILADIEGIQWLQMVRKLQAIRLAVDNTTMKFYIEKYLPPADFNSSVLSAYHIEYLLYTTILNYQVKNKSDTYRMQDIYSEIKKNYPPYLRDKLIATYLLNTHYRFGELKNDAVADYDISLSMAYEDIKNPILKKAIYEKISKFAVGSKALNFDLPDANGNRVKLSDFKGKVVLIDIYGTVCTGCRIFAATLKEKVFPVFKDNPDVIFIAISTEPDKERWLKDIEDGHNTSKEYERILYTEGLGVKHPYTQYYNINAVPTLFLIDRQGVLANTSAVTLTSLSSGEDIVSMINFELKKKYKY